MEGDLVALAPTNHKGITIDEVTTRFAVQGIFGYFQDFSLDLWSKVEGAVHFKSFWWHVRRRQEQEQNMNM